MKRHKQRTIMCEIFGITSKNKIQADYMLNKFFSHSVEHQHGWGIAIFDGFSVSVEREPVKALDSVYLKNRLTGDFLVDKMMAHIRRATSGLAEYNNTHPFVKADESGRKWTLVHNGHIFDAPVLRKYIPLQSGTTDTERILLHIVDQVNRKFMDELSYFDVNERFQTIDRVVTDLSRGNKLNLLLYDGEYMYVHNNQKDSLFIKHSDNCSIFSTKSLCDDNWEPLPENQLFIYHDGELIYEGERHENTYVSDPERERSLYLGFSGL